MKTLKTQNSIIERSNDNDMTNKFKSENVTIEQY